MRFATVLCACLALSAALLGPVSAAPAKPFDPNVPSYCDLTAVLEEYRKTSEFAKYQQRMQEQRQKFTEELQFLSKIRYCTEAERKEALTLNAKPKPTEAEKARLEVLLKKSDAIDNEIMQLSQKMNPTEAETKRIGELSQLRQDSARSFGQAQSERQKKLGELDQNMLMEVQSDLLKVVEKVAKDHKLPYVLNRTSVLFGGNDLTQEVVKKLPK